MVFIECKSSLVINSKTFHWLTRCSSQLVVMTTTVPSMFSHGTPVIGQECSPLLHSVMASRMEYYDSQMLNRDCENAIQLYSKVAKDINGLVSLNAAAKLKKFLLTFGTDSVQADIMRDLQHAARLYDKAELAGRDYARKARNCAEENILVANGVLQGKQYYTPQDVLDAFEDMVDGLLEEYNQVITKHNDVVDRMSEISNKAGRAKVRAQREVREAEDGIVRHAPLAAPFVGAVECAQQFSNAADNVPAKAVLGFLGAIAGVVKGAITSVLIVPMAVNIADRAKYQKMTEEFEELVKELDNVENIISNHRELLTKINGPVKNLSQKYKKINGRKELRPAMLHRIVLESNNLITACDNYLQK